MTKPCLVITSRPGDQGMFFARREMQLAKVPDRLYLAAILHEPRHLNVRLVFRPCTQTLEQVVDKAHHVEISPADMFCRAAAALNESGADTVPFIDVVKTYRSSYPVGTEFMARVSTIDHAKSFEEVGWL